MATELQLQLKEGDKVDFEDPQDFPQYTTYNPPFTVMSSRFKDPDDKGRAESLWEECATLKDSNGALIEKEIPILYLIRADK